MTCFREREFYRVSLSILGGRSTDQLALFHAHGSSHVLGQSRPRSPNTLTAPATCRNTSKVEVSRFLVFFLPYVFKVSLHYHMSPYCHARKIIIRHVKRQVLRGSHILREDTPFGRDCNDWRSLTSFGAIAQNEKHVFTRHKHYLLRNR